MASTPTAMLMMSSYSCFSPHLTLRWRHRCSPGWMLRLNLDQTEFVFHLGKGSPHQDLFISTTLTLPWQQHDNQLRQLGTWEWPWMMNMEAVASDDFSFTTAGGLTPSSPGRECRCSTRCLSSPILTTATPSSLSTIRPLQLIQKAANHLLSVHYTSSLLLLHPVQDSGAGLLTMKGTAPSCLKSLVKLSTSPTTALLCLWMFSCPIPQRNLWSFISSRSLLLHWSQHSRVTAHLLCSHLFSTHYILYVVYINVHLLKRL